MLGVVYLGFTLACVPQIVAEPKIYNSWGNFFEQFSLMTGPGDRFCACGVTMVSANANPARLHFRGHLHRFFCSRAGVLSSNTASLVPKWLPPTQIFWAVITTVLFALAALALLYRIEWQLSRLAF